MSPNLNLQGPKHDPDAQSSDPDGARHQCNGWFRCRRLPTLSSSWAKVIATGRRQDRLATLKDELGERCHTIELDVTKREAVFEAVELLPEPFERPNVCVANACLALGRGLTQAIESLSRRGR